LQSGLGLTATLGGASVLNIGGERQARPNLVGDPVLPESERTLGRWFNTDAFAAFNAPPLPSSFHRSVDRAGRKISAQAFTPNSLRYRVSANIKAVRQTYQ